MSSTAPDNATAPQPGSTPTTSYFVPAGADSYTPTEHVGGAWNDEELHFSPVAGLLVHHMDRWRNRHADADKMIGRVSFDILGRLARGDIELSTRVIRPGRTIELLETTATIGGRVTITARAWLLSVQDTGAVAGGKWSSLPAPETLPEYDLTAIWPGGYIASVVARRAGKPEPGHARVWLRSPLALVAGEDSSPVASYIALIDTANGIAVRQRPEDWMFPNLDLTVHLFRQPSGRWVGFDTTVAYGPTGQGLTSSVLHDLDGPLGSAEQILTVRPNGEG